MIPNFNKFFLIMLFYLIISYIIGPIVGYYALDKTLKSAGHGFVAGSILSIILWFLVGSKAL
jgi:hypothetical protein